MKLMIAILNSFNQNKMSLARFEKVVALIFYAIGFEFATRKIRVHLCPSVVKIPA
jgi:hypothetical protein